MQSPSVSGIVFSRKSGLLAGVASVGILATSVLAQQQPAVIKVTDHVIHKAEDLQPLGINMFGDGGGTKYSAGNIIFDSGFEPVTMRALYRVIDSGKDKGRFWVTLDGPGTSYYQTLYNGTYSGGSMRAYRFVDGAGQPLPYKPAKMAEGGKILDATNGKSFIPLFNTTVVAKGDSTFPDGGWLAPAPDTIQAVGAMSKPEKDKLREGWRVYYEGGDQLRMDDIVIFERTFAWPDVNDFHPRTRGKGVTSRWTWPVGGVRFVELAADAPAEMNGGHGALELTPDGGVGQLWNKLFCGQGSKEASWYGALESGLKYRYEAWAKVDGAAAGSLTLGFGTEKADGLSAGYYGNKIQKQFRLTNQWQRVGFEFSAPATPAEGPIEGAVLRYEGEGKLLLDNVKLQPVYAPGDADKPFVIYKRTFNELMSTQPTTGRKGALRIWAGLNDGRIEDLCSWTPGSKVSPNGTIRVESNDAVTLPKALTIAQATGESPETRMVPWIIIQVMSSEDDYRRLVEYLSAPYDASTDTPQSKPMAYQRSLQRGNGRPWTADFRQIIIEFGNENWHNRLNENWVGMGRYGAVHQAGTEYGLWAKYMTEQMQKSPYWDAGKLKICLGGNYTAVVNADGSLTGYGQEAAIAAGGANFYNGHATYVGPRWETGDHSQTTIDDNGVQKTLLSYRVRLIDEWTAQAKAQERLVQMGPKSEMVAYEGGPSGFGLKAKTPEEDRAGEYYGKSNAMGTAAADALLDAWRLGWTYQCYFNFGQGRWWNSHTSFGNGFRPSPGFLWETLINENMANMDMVNVSVTGSPTTRVDVPPKKNAKGKTPESVTVEFLQAHAMHDARRTSVAVMNLDLQKEHVFSIQIPSTHVRRISLYTLTGETRDSNLDASKVKIETKQLDTASLKNGSLTARLDAGKGAIYVFENE